MTDTSTKYRIKNVLANFFQVDWAYPSYVIQVTLYLRQNILCLTSMYSEKAFILWKFIFMSRRLQDLEILCFWSFFNWVPTIYINSDNDNWSMTFFRSPGAYCQTSTKWKGGCNWFPSSHSSKQNICCPSWAMLHEKPRIFIFTFCCKSFNFLRIQTFLISRRIPSRTCKAMIALITSVFHVCFHLLLLSLKTLLFACCSLWHLTKINHIQHSLIEEM